MTGASKVLGSLLWLSIWRVPTAFFQGPWVPTLAVSFLGIGVPSLTVSFIGSWVLALAVFLSVLFKSPILPNRHLLLHPWSAVLEILMGLSCDPLVCLIFLHFRLRKVHPEQEECQVCARVILCVVCVCVCGFLLCETNPDNVDSRPTTPRPTRRRLCDKRRGYERTVILWRYC